MFNEFTVVSLRRVRRIIMILVVLGQEMNETRTI